MQKLFKAGFIVPILSLLLLVNAPARADAFASTINSFRNAGESGKFFDTAYGYAVFPTIGRIGSLSAGSMWETPP
jgi:hypothetical protein